MWTGTPLVELDAGDAEELADLITPALGAGFHPASVREELARSGGFALAVREAGAIEAAILGWIVAGELEINVVVVRERARRRGHGRALVEGALARARTAGAEHAFLELRASNVAATELYLRCGFQISGRRRSYYRDGEDAITMSRSLS